MRRLRTVLIVGVCLLGVLAALSAAAQEPPWERNGALGIVWWPLVGLAAVVVVFIIVLMALLHVTPVVLALLAAVFGVRWFMRRGQEGADQALEILRERYARGEISRDEFEARRRDLRDR